MGAFLKTHGDVALIDEDIGGGVDEVAEDVLKFGGGVAVADSFPEEPIEAAGHHGQLQIATDLHGNGRGQCVHVEEVDAVGDAVLDQHALRVPSDEMDDGTTQLVGQHNGGLFVAQLGNDNLADGGCVVSEGDGLVQDARRAIGAGDAFQFDAPPGRGRLLADLLDGRDKPIAMSRAFFRSDSDCTLHRARFIRS